jgi:hypothetical protein
MANHGLVHDVKVLTIADLKKEASKNLPLVYQQYFNEGAGDLLTYIETPNYFLNSLTLGSAVCVITSKRSIDIVYDLGCCVTSIIRT